MSELYCQCAFDKTVRVQWRFHPRAARAIRDAHGLAGLSVRAEPRLYKRPDSDTHGGEGMNFPRGTSTPEPEPEPNPVACIHLLEALLAQDELWESVSLPTTLVLAQVHQALSEEPPTRWEHWLYRFMMIRMATLQINRDTNSPVIDSSQLLQAILHTPGRAQAILRRCGFR